MGVDAGFAPVVDVNTNPLNQSDGARSFSDRSNVVQGYVQLLDEGVYGSLSEKQRGVLQTLETQIESLARLVKQLLDVSRFEAGGGKLELRRVALSPFLDELERAFHVLALQRDIQHGATGGAQQDGCTVHAEPTHVIADGAFVDDAERPGQVHGVPPSHAGQLFEAYVARRILVKEVANTPKPCRLRATALLEATARQGQRFHSQTLRAQVREVVVHVQLRGDTAAQAKQRQGAAQQGAAIELHRVLGKQQGGFRVGREKHLECAVAAKALRMCRMGRAEQQVTRVVLVGLPEDTFLVASADDQTEPGFVMGVRGHGTVGSVVGHVEFVDAAHSPFPGPPS